MQTRIAMRAHAAAVKRLIEKHPNEFHAYYREETDKRGVAAKPTTGIVPKRARTQPLVDAIMESGVLDGVDIPEVVLVPDIPNTPTVEKQKLTRVEQLNAHAAGVLHRDAALPHPPVPEPPW